MRFIYQQRMDHIAIRFGIGPRPFEQIIDAGDLKGLFQLLLIHLSWRTVFGNILYQLIPFGQFGQ